MTTLYYIYKLASNPAIYCFNLELNLLLICNELVKNIFIASLISVAILVIVQWAHKSIKK